MSIQQWSYQNQIKMLKNKFILKLSIKILVALVIISVAGTLDYFLVKKIKQLNLATREKKEINYLLRNREETTRQIQADFKKIDSDYEAKIYAALPSVYNVLPFVEALDSLAKKYNLKSELNFSQPAPLVSPVGPISLSSVNFSASLRDANIDILVAYLKDLEKLTYFSSIQTININGTNGWNNNSTINFSGRLYAQE